MSQVEQNYMRKDKDGSLDGRLDMINHRISDLADPTDADDAVSRRYVASRFQALNDEVRDNKSKLDALQNLLGVENNQVLIRKYEIIGADFVFAFSTASRDRVMFSKQPYDQTDIGNYEFF